MAEPSTCGEGLAAHSELHAKLADLLAAVGRNLELHLTALDSDDEASRPEHEAYTRLVWQHRRLEEQLRSTADEMASYRELPMANHDPDVMGGPAVMEAFQLLVTREEELLALLRGWVERDRAMLEDAGGKMDSSAG